jgi:hypothetical protein
VSAILPVASVIAVPAITVRPQIEQPATRANAPAAPQKHVEPIRYYGGLDGMNATNLIVALQSNGAVSGGYSATANETGTTPPPVIVDRGA